MKILMAGSGFPMLATHDPTLIDIGLKLAGDHGRRPGDFEFQMLYAFGRLSSNDSPDSAMPYVSMSHTAPTGTPILYGASPSGRQTYGSSLGA